MAASVQVPGVESEKAPWLTVKLSSPLRTAILALFVAVVSYLACWLGGTIILHNQGISVLWPACAVLVSVMLLVPSRAWPVLIPAGLAGFVVHDLRSGFALWQIALLNLGDTIEILIVGLGLRYFFNGIPRLNSLKALAQYCFFAVFLGPFVSSFVGAAATPGSYIVNWRLWFFSDALAFLTVTPAILSWASERRVWTYRSLHSKLEAVSLVAAVALLGYFTLLAPWRATPSVLIYTFVPFLLWAAVRFGSLGVSTSMIVISFLSIWGAIYGHGPFSGTEPYRTVLSLQLFLMFAAIPFMALAALAEERGRDHEVLHESEERFRLAAQAGRMFAYSWDAATDVIERSAESTTILGIEEATPLTCLQAMARVHPDDREGFLAAMASLSPEKPFLQVCYRIIRPDESLIWVERHSQAYFDEHGTIKRMIGMVVDITERKRAEEIRSRHSAIVESSEDAIISKTLDATIVGWNAGARRIFGYTEEETVGQPITILIPPELLDEENRILEKLRAGERIEHYETIRVTKTGQKVNVSLCISAIKDLTGKTVGFSKIARDITERKRAEEALRASEERLRLAQQAAQIGTFEWNIRTGVNTWTPALEAMYGLPPGGFSGTQTAFENLVHPDDRARVIEMVEGALKTGQCTQGEWRVVWPDGSIHWIAGRWQLFRNESGEPSRMIGVNGDVTQRKLAEKALRESEQRLRLATQVARMYAYDWDVKADLVVRSSEHVNILGLTEPLDANHQFVDKIHPDDRPRFLATIARLTPENPTGEVTYRASASDGTLAWLKSNGRGFFDAEGKLLRVIGMVADVTDSKRAEEALAGMTRKLIEAQEQERTRISRELHDDISQRLALLAIELDQLREKRNDLPSEVRGHVQELQQMAAEISSSVHTLSHDLHSSKLEYLGVVAGIKSWCKEFGERQKMGVDFTTNVVSALPPEVGVPLLRVVQEALHNAVKHSGARQALVQLCVDSGEIHLVVSDLGKGFDVEAALQGKGLGLTSMRERVRMLNGTIMIESKSACGTTIHVRVPFSPEHVSRRAAGS
jgi:PAS domain S-box-containing protein